MNKSQEPKYMIISTPKGFRLANRTSGEVIPDDEPLMILRGRDRHAGATILHYATLCQDPHHADLVRARAQEFGEFAAKNPGRIKEPDTGDASD
jgi:hypothetical protein